MTGSLALACAQRDGRSYLERIRYDGLWRISRPQRDGDAVRVVAAHLGPGIIGGDRYAGDVRVAAGARLVVTGQMATPVYARDVPSSTETRWQVAPGGVLVVRAEPLMLDVRARHDVRTTIDVAGDGCAIVADIVTVAPGALARLRTTARLDGRLVARDACDLHATDGAIATLLVVGGDPQRHAALERALEFASAPAAGVRVGIGTLPGALLLRATGPQVWPLRSMLDAGIAAARALTPVRLGSHEEAWTGYRANVVA